MLDTSERETAQGLLINPVENGPANKGNAARAGILSDAEASAQRRRENIRKKRARVLVMDDEEYMRDILCYILKCIGHTVDTVSDGDEAVRVFSQAHGSAQPVDLVVLDLCIPGGKNGKDVLAEIRTIDPNVFAIAASGYSDDPVIANPKRFGFQGSIAKPFSRDDMKRLLNEAVVAQSNL